MNRGFCFYFKKAINRSATTVWKNKNVFSYYVYCVMSLIARATLILGCMFDIADVRQAKIAAKDGKIDLAGSFCEAAKAKPFWTMFACALLEGLIVLGGIAVIGVLTALLGTVGYLIGLAAPSAIFYIDIGAYTVQGLIGVFSIPGLIVLAAYLVIMPLVFTPTAYVIDTNPGISVSETISICFKTMKTRGKWTYFITFFVCTVICLAILGLGYGGLWLLNRYLYGFDYLAVIQICWAIVILLAFFAVAPIFGLARRIAVNDLFSDIAQDPLNAQRHTDGINIKKCKGLQFDPATYENNLAFLFDETAEKDLPAADSPKALREEKRRKKQEEKMAAEKPVQAEKPATVEAVEPAKPVETPAAEEDKKVEEVAPEPVASEPVEEPEQVEEPAEEEKAEEVEEKAEESEQPSEQSAEQSEGQTVAEPAEEITATPAAEGEEEKEPEKDSEQPEEKPAEKEVKPRTTAARTTTRTSTARTTATKSTAAKTGTTRSTATKSTAAKTATKSTATKTTAAKTATKSTATKTTAAKTATKSTATKSTAAKKTATAAKSDK